MTPLCEVCGNPAESKRLCADRSELLSLYILTQAIAETVLDGAQ